eukprot:CAMPEP_0194070742 /NCGR_PEP_ID=MMETSP0009_2-20130614/88341_1 /TAXON_ID=210454 /ORGANISM="Grammatophora oceanica, Strain CCMP 410" /LENGTH=417 /DNA_ID=CAMNT_0038724029 /DNA_START=917 /DNA_END=2170 /DNA_ORIENTATION=-
MAIGDEDFGSPTATPQLRRSAGAGFGDEKGNVPTFAPLMPMTGDVAVTTQTNLEGTAEEVGTHIISSVSLVVASSPPMLSPSSSSSSLEELVSVHVARRRCQSGEALVLGVSERLSTPFAPEASQRSLATDPAENPDSDRKDESGKPRRRKRDHVSVSAGRSPWLIPADHPYKIAWDMCTILLSCASAILTHQSIRDRSFQITTMWVLTQLWFITDIILNFFTIKVLPDGSRVQDEKGVWARYLTTWFAVDVLSLVPWENMYVQPIIDRQRRRNLFVKSFFRTRAVIKVTRLLRGRHFRAFGRVARQTKHAGVGARRLLRLIIKYVPKYLLFYRNMKGILAVRLLRLLHWVRKIGKHVLYASLETETVPPPLESNESLWAMRAVSLAPESPLRRRVKALSSAFESHQSFDDITDQMS